MCGNNNARRRFLIVLKSIPGMRLVRKRHERQMRLLTIVNGTFFVQSFPEFVLIPVL